MKVLLIEDVPEHEEWVRRALRFDHVHLVQSLERRGIQITPPDPQRDIIVARTKETAIKEIRGSKVPFDLVVLDLAIPERPGLRVDFQKGPLLGFELVSEIRDRFGNDTAIVIYSERLNAESEDATAKNGLIEFTDMLRERHISPPNEMLWKKNYFSDASLMPKLVRYAIDLTPADERTLTDDGILVPKQGATRQVLRDLKRMACSASIGFPRPDVLLLGENGVGKTTFARAYHLLRPHHQDHPQLGFHHLDLGSLDFAGSAPNIALFGATDFNGAWSLGAFVRSTLYKRNKEFVTFAGQEITGGSARLYSPLGRSSYPETSDIIDFDGSGTLFLDEVVNVGLETQKMLLQAISYDLHTRHVYTTGHEPRRLQVGPSLVFATAQWDPTKEAPPREVSREGQFGRMKDYFFRIDQMRVTIPPLRARRPEEVLQLLIALVKKRRPPTPAPTLPITVDPIVERLLTSALIFRNNVADLQRIADQVMPEEDTITWQHVGPLFERERPLMPEIRHTTPPPPTSSQAQDYQRAQEIYDRYRKSGNILPLSRLAHAFDIRPTDAYNVALVFLDACGCTTLKRWPNDDQTLQVFGHSAKAFQTYMHRLSPDRHRGFGITSALRHLANLKGFPSEPTGIPPQAQPQNGEA